MDLECRLSPCQRLRKNSAQCQYAMGTQMIEKIGHITAVEKRLWHRQPLYSTQPLHSGAKYASMVPKPSGPIPGKRLGMC
jgi:hypothetical protein